MFRKGMQLLKSIFISRSGRNHFDARVGAWIFIGVSIYALAAMVILRELIIPHEFVSVVAGNIPGDPDYYHGLALERVNAIRAGGMAQFQLRPAGQGPAGVASLVYMVYPDPYGVVLINALLHGVSALMMTMILLHWFSLRAALIAIIPLVISPYMMVWFSQINKDSFVLTGVLLIEYGLLRFVRVTERQSVREGLVSLLFMVPGIVLLWIMRPYLNQVLLPIVGLVLMSGFWWRANESRPSGPAVAVFACYGAIIIACLGLFGQGAASSETLRRFENFVPTVGAGGNSMSARCLDHIEKSVWRNESALPTCVNRKLRAMMGQRCLTLTLLETQTSPAISRSMVDADQWPGGSREALSYLPRAMMLGFFSPWPDAWNYVFRNGPSFFYTVVPLEAVLMYVGLAALCLWSLRTRSWMILIPLGISVGVSAAYGMTTPFLGGLYRYRYPFWMMMICLGVAALAELGAPKSAKKNGRAVERDSF